MNYCGINEAYNETYKYCNNKVKDPNNKIILPDTFDNYNNIDVKEYDNLENCQNIHSTSDTPRHPAFFTAQGEYNNKCSNTGTSINDLKGNTIDNLSILDTDISVSDNLSFLTDKSSVKTSKNSYNHKYCIDKMVNNFINEPDINSVASSQNDAQSSRAVDVYKHVNSCKYCKTKINEKVKKYFSDNSNYNNKNNNNLINTEHFNFDGFKNNLGYDIKELFIIILSGLSLIFILDLLVKIGRKSQL